MNLLAEMMPPELDGVDYAKGDMPRRKETYLLPIKFGIAIQSSMIDAHTRPALSWVNILFLGRIAGT